MSEQREFKTIVDLPVTIPETIVDLTVTIPVAQRVADKLADLGYAKDGERPSAEDVKEAMEVVLKLGLT